MLITSNFPIDETFLNSMINESILYFTNGVNCTITFNGHRVVINSDDSLEDSFKRIYSLVRVVNVGMVRNDRHFIKDFKKYFNINLEIKQTFQDLLVKIKENIDKFEFRYDSINLSPNVKGLIVLLESIERKVDVVAPQIYKIDRFTGYTSLETSFTTKQLKLRCLGETALLLLLGLTSSYICGRKDGNNRCYYFLTFAPDEVLRLYLESSKELIRKYFLVKDEVIRILKESYTIASANEIALTELVLNLNIRTLLSEHNLDKLSFILFKIVREGQDSYKIYEQIPITIYRKIVFAEIVERYFKNPDGFIKSLAEIFENKRSRLWRAVASLNSKNKLDEADNVLKAMQSLYRFVVLGDLQGYYQFAREIFNCYQKTGVIQYKQILEKLRWF